MRTRPSPSACCWASRRVFARTSSTERSEESSTNSADSASRLEAARIFAQRVCGTLPLRRSSPLIDAWLAMKRCASSPSRHLEAEQRDGLLAGERRVLGEVGHQRAVVDDDVVGHEVVLARDGEVVRLLLPEVLDRGDLVPPQVARGEAGELAAVRRLARAWPSWGRERPRVPTCQLWLRGRPAAALISAHERSPFAARTCSHTAIGSVSKLVLVGARRAVREDALEPVGSCRRSPRGGRTPRGRRGPVMRTSRATVAVPS